MHAVFFGGSPVDTQLGNSHWTGISSFAANEVAATPNVSANATDSGASTHLNSLAGC
jgi:hypothetical protein